MLHSARIEALAKRLAPASRGPASHRRRQLLGAILETKAGCGAFDLELLHYWLDSALARRADRALFGLDATAPATRGTRRR